MELEILRNCSTIFRSSHRRCSIEKLFSNILWYSQENTCVVINRKTPVSFLIKMKALRPVTLLKRTAILSNICKRLLLKFNESVFWSWNIIILNLLLKMYFMCILLSDCTNTVVTRLKNQFVIFNPWKVQWNWVAFSQNSCYITWFVISPD